MATEISNLASNSMHWLAVSNEEDEGQNMEVDGEASSAQDASRQHHSQQMSVQTSQSTNRTSQLSRQSSEESAPELVDESDDDQEERAVDEDHNVFLKPCIFDRLTKTFDNLELDAQDDYIQLLDKKIKAESKHLATKSMYEVLGRKHLSEPTIVQSAHTGDLRPECNGLMKIQNGRDVFKHFIDTTDGEQLKEWTAVSTTVCVKDKLLKEIEHNLVPNTEDGVCKAPKVAYAPNNSRRQGLLCPLSEATLFNGPNPGANHGTNFVKYPHHVYLNGILNNCYQNPCQGWSFVVARLS